MARGKFMLTLAALAFLMGCKPATPPNPEEFKHMPVFYLTGNKGDNVIIRYSDNKGAVSEVATSNAYSDLSNKCFYNTQASQGCSKRYPFTSVMGHSMMQTAQSAFEATNSLAFLIAQTDYEISHGKKFPRVEDVNKSTSNTNPTSIIILVYPIGRLRGQEPFLIWDLDNDGKADVVKGGIGENVYAPCYFAPGYLGGCGGMQYNAIPMTDPVRGIASISLSKGIELAKMLGMRP